VLAVVVHGDFGIVLGQDEQDTAGIAKALDIKNAATSDLSFARSRHGDDGFGTLIDCAVFVRNSRKYRFVFPKAFAA